MPSLKPTIFSLAAALCLATVTSALFAQPQGYYDIPSAGVSGAVPIQRIVADMVPLCESLNQSTAE